MKKKIFKVLFAFALIFTFAFPLVACGSKPSICVFFHLNDFGAKVEAEFSENYLKKYNIKESRSIGFMKWDYDNLLKDAPKPEEIVPPKFEDGGEIKEKVFGGWYYDTAGAEGKLFNKETWQELDAVKEHRSISLYAKWLDKGQNIITFNLNDKTMNFTNDYKTAQNIKTRIPTFIFDDLGENSIDNVLVKFPTKKDIDESNFDNVFEGWCLNGDLISESNLAGKIKELQEKGIHCFNLVAKWKAYPQMTFSFQVANLQKYGVIFYKNGLDYKIDMKIRNQFSEFESKFPTVNDMESSENNIKNGMILTGENANVELVGFYVDEEFARPLNEETFNEIVAECKKGSDCKYQISGNNFQIKIYTKMDYVRHGLNIEIFSNDYGATKTFALTEEYKIKNNVNEQNIFNLKNYSFEEILAVLPKPEDLIPPEYGNNKKEFLCFEISKVEKGRDPILADREVFTKQSYDKLIKDKSIDQVRFTIIWQDVK